MTPQESAALALNIKTAIASRLARHDPGLISHTKGLREDRLDHIASMLHESDVLLWDRDIFRLAISGSDAFGGSLLAEQMVEEYRPEFWVFREFFWNPSSQMRGVMSVPDSATIYGVLLYPHAQGLNYILFLADESLPKTPLLHGSGVLFGMPISGPLANIIAAHEFTRMKVATKEPVLLPRSERRRMLRQEVRAPDVRIVQLRGREASIWHGVASREYHHSWIVRGHWRRLHEPRIRDGAVTTWVESYVKGVGPLLKARETVYAVNR